LPDRGGKTCLELAHTPNLDAMAQEGVVGLVRTVPLEMEPSSAYAHVHVRLRPQGLLPGEKRHRSQKHRHSY